MIRLGTDEKLGKYLAFILRVFSEVEVEAPVRVPHTFGHTVYLNTHRQFYIATKNKY